MCVYSNVMDHFEPIIPKPWEPDIRPLPGSIPTVNPFQINSFPWTPQIDLAELRKLIDEFKEAMVAAKTVDRIVGHPDCEDPEKKKLEDRVRELERLLKVTERAAKTAERRSKPYVVRYSSIPVGMYLETLTSYTGLQLRALRFATAEDAREAADKGPTYLGVTFRIVRLVPKGTKR